MTFLAQVPAPPPAPEQHVSVTGSLEGWDAVALLLILGALVAVILWPLIRAWALEEMQPRMVELEERVEFAERILVRGQESPEPDRLPGR